MRLGELRTDEQGRLLVLGGFGASAPYKDIFKNYKITPERVAEEALRLLGRPADIDSSEPEAEAIPGRQPAGHEGHS